METAFICYFHFLILIEGAVKMNNINIILELDENIKINSHPNELLQCLFNIFISSKIKKDQVIIK
jgi:hypothetical protein